MGQLIGADIGRHALEGVYRLPKRIVICCIDKILDSLQLRWHLAEEGRNDFLYQSVALGWIDGFYIIERCRIQDG